MAEMPQKLTFSKQVFAHRIHVCHKLSSTYAEVGRLVAIRHHMQHGSRQSGCFC